MAAKEVAEQRFEKSAPEPVEALQCCEGEATCEFLSVASVETIAAQRGVDGSTPFQEFLGAEDNVHGTVTERDHDSQ